MLSKEKDAAYKQTALEQILSQDPRPAYKQDKQDLKVYAVQLFDWDVSFQVVEKSIVVTGIKPLCS
ncbi:hypothetical protein JCM19232_114 [Vibrio ishigakensis]|uniref:TrmO C-terminal domain-containing protein n=1 Tax=Vibrio ishigakensis TaxID=1481914 RepID=A0A0B8PDP1_9VIBR|nr:hypothetical protein JCM19232_114 [Vibrio ishigakensis]